MEPSVPELGERFARVVHVILVREFLASGWSPSQWATAAGVDRSALGKWVAAYRAPTLTYAVRLCLALGLPFAEVVTAAVGLVWWQQEATMETSPAIRHPPIHEGQSGDHSAPSPVPAQGSAKCKNELWHQR